MACAGDVNNDGYDDLIIGSPEYLGGAIASAGDVNGDGYGDMVVGAPEAHNGLNYGKVWVFHGNGSGVDSSHS